MAAAPADASHLKGGHVSASISDAGSMTVKLHWLERDTSCADTLADAADNSYDESGTVTAPDGTTTHDVDVFMVPTRCLGSTIIYDGVGTLDLNDPAAFGPVAPDGLYRIDFSSCCRVGGIINSSARGFSLGAGLHHAAGQASASPYYPGMTATGAARNYLYSGDVTAFGANGTDLLSYLLMQRADNTLTSYSDTAPDTNVVTLSGSRAEVPGSVTGTWNVGNYFVYKTKASDAAGNFAEQDILVQITDNQPPAFAEVPGLVTVVEGTTKDVALAATDPDNGTPKLDSVSMTLGSSPSWTTLEQTPGNPATGTLRFAPAVGQLGTYPVSLDAADDDPAVVLTDARTMTVRVIPAAPRIVTKPADSSSDTSPSFSFEGAAEGETYECSLDGADFTTCPATWQASGLAVGEHTLAVRRRGASGEQGEPAEYRWTVAAPVPAPAPKDPAPVLAPVATSAPAPARAVCASARKMTVNWRAPRGGLSGRILVRVDGKIVKRLSSTTRRVTVDVGRAGKRLTRVAITARTTRGVAVRTTRTYRPCTPRRPGGKPSLMLNKRG
ncbi:MAG: hypothetical protein H0V81_13050 [Solirubrobacterales bacterium]|nr:hypothetical protein [Solirubrobacterales bacterium]